MVIQRMDSILNFWFGDLSSTSLPDENISQRWWQKDELFDRDIKALFATDIQNAITGKYDDWLADSKGSLALIIIVDQFCRNVFRDTPESFEHDGLALNWAKAAVDQGIDQKLLPIQRVFIYLPFEHSEDLADQKQSVKLFAELLDSVQQADKVIFENFYDYAIAHFDIIKEFGRFPHRNEILNRQSTPKELEYLQQPGAGF